MRLFLNTNYQFIPNRKIYFIISAILILTGLTSFIVKGGFKYGIDFKGGTLFQVKFQETPDIGKVREVFDKYKDIGSVEIKVYGNKKENELIIGVEEQTSVASMVERVTEILNNEFTGKFEIRREEAVGPRIGQELKWKAMIAILLSWIAIIIYLWVRFQFKFSVAAVLGLIHDLLIVLGACSIFNVEMSMTLVAAFLTIIGYSLNDTIVVFDRVRENLFIDKRMDVLELFNRSINQTLSRTLITSGPLLLAVLSLYTIGVSTIQDFAFAMCIGIITGTYSSFGISLSLLAEWKPETLRLHKMA